MHVIIMYKNGMQITEMFEVTSVTHTSTTTTIVGRYVNDAAGTTRTVEVQNELYMVRIMEN